MEHKIAKHTGLILTLTVLLFIGGLSVISSLKLDPGKLLSQIIPEASTPHAVQLIRAHGAPFVTYRIHAPYILDSNPDDLTLTLLPPRLIQNEQIVFHQGEYLRGVQINGATYEITRSGSGYQIEIDNITAQNSPILGTIMLNVLTRDFISQAIDVESNGVLTTLKVRKFNTPTINLSNRIANTSSSLIYYPGLHTPQLIAPGETIMADFSSPIGYTPLLPAKFTQFQVDSQLTFANADTFADVYFPPLPSLTIEDGNIIIPHNKAAAYNTLIFELTELNGFKRYISHNLNSTSAPPLPVDPAYLSAYFQSVKYAWAFLEPSNAPSQSEWRSLFASGITTEQNFNYLSQWRDLSLAIEQGELLPIKDYTLSVSMVKTEPPPLDPITDPPTELAYIGFLSGTKIDSLYDGVRRLTTSKQRVFRNESDLTLTTKLNPATFNTLTSNSNLYSTRLTSQNSSTTLHIPEDDMISNYPFDDWKAGAWQQDGFETLLCIGETADGEQYSIPYKTTPVVTIGDCYSAVQNMPEITKLYFYVLSLSNQGGQPATMRLTELGQSEVLHSSLPTITLTNYNPTTATGTLNSSSINVNQVAATFHSNSELTQSESVDFSINNGQITFNNLPSCAKNCYLTLQAKEESGTALNLSPSGPIYIHNPGNSGQTEYCIANADISTLITDQKVKGLLINEQDEEALTYNAATNCLKQSATSTVNVNDEQTSFLITATPKPSGAVCIEGSSELFNPTTNVCKEFCNSGNGSPSTVPGFRVPTGTECQTSTPGNTGLSPHFDELFTLYPQTFSFANSPSHHAKLINLQFSAPLLKSSQQLSDGQSPPGNYQFTSIINATDTLNPINTSLRSPLISTYNPLQPIQVAAPSRTTSVYPLHRSTTEPYIPHVQYNFSPDEIARDANLFEDGNMKVQFNVISQDESETLSTTVSTVDFSSAYRNGVNLLLHRPLTLDLNTTGIQTFTNPIGTYSLPAILTTQIEGLNTDAFTQKDPPLSTPAEISNPTLFTRVEVTFAEVSTELRSSEENPIELPTAIRGQSYSVDLPFANLLSGLNYTLDEFIITPDSCASEITVSEELISADIPLGFSAQSCKISTTVNLTEIIANVTHNHTSTVYFSIPFSNDPPDPITESLNYTFANAIAIMPFTISLPETVEPLDSPAIFNQNGITITLNTQNNKLLIVGTPVNFTTPLTANLTATGSITQLEYQYTITFNPANEVEILVPLYSDFTNSFSIKNFLEERISVPSFGYKPLVPDAFSSTLWNQFTILTTPLPEGLQFNNSTTILSVTDLDAIDGETLIFKVRVGIEQLYIKANLSVLSSITTTLTPLTFTAGKNNTIDLNNTIPTLTELTRRYKVEDSNPFLFNGNATLRVSNAPETPEFNITVKDTQNKEIFLLPITITAAPVEPEPTTKCGQDEKCDHSDELCDEGSKYHHNTETDDCWMSRCGIKHTRGVIAPIPTTPEEFLEISQAPWVVSTAPSSSCNALRGTADCFPDITNLSNIYKSEICKAKADSIIAGSNGQFLPHNNLNRAEATKILITGPGFKFGTSSKSEIDTLSFNLRSKPTTQFPDVPSSQWFAPYIIKATSIKIAKGYPDGTYQPARSVNYAEASKLIVNTLRTFAADESKLAKTFNSCLSPDQPWYYPFVQTINLNGGDFHPVTNADAMATAIKRDQFVYNTMLMIEAAQSQSAPTLCGSEQSVVSPPDSTSPASPTATDPNVSIANNFGSKIVYSLNTSSDLTPFQSDCTNRAGQFKECGNQCAIGVQVCADVCALTCESIPPDKQLPEDTQVADQSPAPEGEDPNPHTGTAGCQTGVFWGKNTSSGTCKLFTTSCVDAGYTFFGQDTSTCDCNTLENTSVFAISECQKKQQ